MFTFWGHYEFREEPEDTLCQIWQIKGRGCTARVSRLRFPTGWGRAPGSSTGPGPQSHLAKTPRKQDFQNCSEGAKTDRASVFTEGKDSDGGPRQCAFTGIIYCKYSPDIGTTPDHNFSSEKSQSKISACAGKCMSGLSHPLSPEGCGAGKRAMRALALLALFAFYSHLRSNFLISF